MTKALTPEISSADAIVLAIAQCFAPEETVTLLQSIFSKAQCLRLCLVASACPIAFISSNLLKTGDVEFLPLPAKTVCCLEAANQGAPLFVSKGTLLESRDAAIIAHQDSCNGLFCVPLQTENQSCGASSSKTSSQVYPIGGTDRVGALLIGYHDEIDIIEQDIQSSILIGNLIADRHPILLESLLAHAAWIFGVPKSLESKSDRVNDAVTLNNNEVLNEDEDQDEDEDEGNPVLDPAQYDLLKSARMKFMLQFPSQDVECAYQQWRVARNVHMDGPLLLLMLVYHLLCLMGSLSSSWKGLTGFAFWNEVSQFSILFLVFCMLSLPWSRDLYLRHRESIMTLVNLSLIWGYLWMWQNELVQNNKKNFARTWKASGSIDIAFVGNSLLVMIAQSSWIVMSNFVARVKYQVQLSLLGLSLAGVAVLSCLIAVFASNLAWSCLPSDILPISPILFLPCIVSYYLEFKSRELFCSSSTAIRLLY